MEDITSPGGAPQNPGGIPESKETQQAEGEKSVSFESYQKLLKEKKSRDEELRSMRDRLSSFEEKEKGALKEQGKWQEYAQELEGKLKDTETKLSKAARTFAYDKVSSQFEAEALKAGCARTDALLKLVDVNSLVESVDENLRIDKSLLKAEIERCKKEFDFLFAKQAPNFRDTPPPSGKPEGAITYEEWLKLPPDEKKKRLPDVMKADAKK